MAVCLLSKDYSTNYCIFSYDDWINDWLLLPNLNTSGKDVLSTVKSCSQGSLAKGTDGTYHILTGENLWVPYQTNSGNNTGGGSGGSGSSSDEGFIEL